MKKVTWWQSVLLFTIVIGWATVVCGAPISRVAQNINSNWKFNSGDVAGAQSPTFNDASWQTVQLPNTPAYTNYELSMTSTAFWRGICWYRKTLAINAAYQGKKVFLEFEGAMTIAQVYVNGTLVTTHSGGFTPFTIDISGSVTFGGNNLIAVRLDNTCDVNSQNQVPPEKPGICFVDFALFGGIYRDVNMIYTDSLYIPDQQLSPGGIFITTPTVSSASASVLIKTAVKNEHKTAQSCVLKTTIQDNSGTIAGTASTTQSIAAGATYTFVQNITVTNPSLWSPVSPALYRAVSEVSAGTTLVDTLTTRFGIRSILINVTGFYLNGTKLKLLGLNRHQTFPIIGDALPDRAQYRDALVLKNMGCNYIRLSHYPQSPAFLNALDELGILCWEEIPSWGTGGARPPAYLQMLYNDIRDMIRRDRNHPSVLVWGVGENEGNNDPSFENMCQSIAKAEDSTHYTTAAKNYNDATNNRFDIYGGNRFMPGELPNSAAEAGIGTGNLVGYINSEYVGHTFPTHRWDTASTLVECAHRHLVMIHLDRQREWVAGGTGWCAFDYISDPVDYPSDGGQEMGTKYHGVMDIFRIPKFSCYAYQSQAAADWYDGSKHPMVFIESYADYPMPSSQTVTVLSNCDQVELFVNDVSQGTQSPDADNGARTTRWCANDAGTGYWWMVDLGASYDLTGTRVIWELANSVYKYIIETSTNGTTWTTAVDKTANTSTAQTQTDNFSASGVRYVRITVTGLSGAAWASFFDFAVMSNGTNVALGKTASASSAQSANPPSGGNDDENTAWALAHAPFTFNINFAAPGNLRAVGKIGGVAKATSTVNRYGTPAKIALSTDTDSLLADGSDIALVHVTITDNSGNHVANASNTVNLSITGAGKLLCDAAGPVANSSIIVRGGKLGFLVQADTLAGPITVNATASGLTQGQLLLTSTKTLAVPVVNRGAAAANPLQRAWIRQSRRSIEFGAFRKDASTTLALINMSGRMVKSAKISGESGYSLSTMELPAGIYQAVVRSGKNIVDKTVLIMK
jgi:beta-galactosidase